MTLAACLGPPLQLRHVDPGHLDQDSEQRLTDWMRQHLNVAVFPFPHPDRLGDLEHHVLTRLNPPLNLDGMTKNQLREPLTRLRARPH